MHINIRLLLGLALATSALTMATGGSALAKQGGNGWQATDGVTIPTGTTDYFEHRPCPTGFSVDSSGYLVLTNATLGNGFMVTGSGPRLDLSPPQYNEWVWNIVWPNGGAPAGSQIVFDVSCKKGAP